MVLHVFLPLQGTGRSERGTGCKGIYSLYFSVPARRYGVWTVGIFLRPSDQ